VLFRFFKKGGVVVKWNVKDFPVNCSRVKWEKDWAVAGDVPDDQKPSISACFIRHHRTADILHPFEQYTDEGAPAFSRRWRLVIFALPKSAHWERRSIQATFYGDDPGLDGSTFGDISICELTPSNNKEIVLEIDFTKVRSQGHRFGVHVQILHNISWSDAG
jgi:hypothetical protein